MKPNRPYIKLIEYLEREDMEAIHALELRCLEQDQTSLKLELDYKWKVGLNADKRGGLKQIHEFLYCVGKTVVGYVGVSSFGGSEPEVNGMVHPDYRGQGVFKRLFGLMGDEMRRRDVKSLLLLSDRLSAEGQAFIRTTGGVYDHSEYEMWLKAPQLEWKGNAMVPQIKLRKATNQDASEVARQNAIYFEMENPQEAQITILPEEEEKRGFIIYLAELEDKVVGKVNLELRPPQGGIYGLGVLPEFRSRGLGRQILMAGVKTLQEMNASEIMLQVNAVNANALKLYESCGFEATSTMDYYRMTL